MTRCKYASQYKALRAPRCGCEACKRKWSRVQRDLSHQRLGTHGS